MEHIEADLRRKKISLKMKPGGSRGGTKHLDAMGLAASTVALFGKSTTPKVGDAKAGLGGLAGGGGLSIAAKGLSKGGDSAGMPTGGGADIPVEVSGEGSPGSQAMKEGTVAMKRWNAAGSVARLSANFGQIRQIASAIVAETAGDDLEVVTT